MTGIRRATADDVAAALEVWRAALAATGARPSAGRTAEVRRQLSASDGLLVVAEGNGDVAGAALGEWARDDDGEHVAGLLRLAVLVVHPSWRRRGVGSALAEGLADAGWPRGARRMTARPPTSLARAFLLACGLTPEGSELVGELEPPVREVVARSGGLRLGQLLKLAGLAPTGAQGKALLAAGEVDVNGAVELRRGRQLCHGDVISARGEVVRVVLSPDGSAAGLGAVAGSKAAMRTGSPDDAAPPEEQT